MAVNEKELLLKTPPFYKELLTILSKKGKIKPPEKTPLEFANTIALPEMKIITEIYYAVRFGGCWLTDKEQSEIQTYLTKIKKTKI
ncbi:MAG: DUF4129 domain-containing protein [Deltaproteobacteria bacterium]|nr:DUF4129 domain-containing protein [Deltaproteobacteria bacterium]